LVALKFICSCFVTAQIHHTTHNKGRSKFLEDPQRQNNEVNATLLNKIFSMKRIFLLLPLFIFINANCQVNDSLKKMEEQREFNEGYFENITGKVLPAFSAKDLNGKIYTGSTITNGKVTFMNFWFSSCEPCIIEIPNLNRLYQMVKGDPNVQFFAITWDTEEQAKETIKKYNIEFPVLIISQTEANKVNFGRGYPTNMVLDKKGQIRSVLSGGSRNAGSEFEKYWDREIDRAFVGNIFTIPQPVQVQKNLSNITFIDSSKIKSLNDLIHSFKEQFLYIDIWASWCLPCRQEFASKNNSVDSFLNKHNVARLYLSIDNPKVKEVWETLVYKYQLTGYHLLAGSDLFRDIKQNIFKSENTIEIPRYTIVKNGKIVELNAFLPSDGQKLISQLTEKLF
jgi:thiol-disulfide isomerase/thioredoxin